MSWPRNGGRAGWIVALVATVSFFGGMGAWTLKQWISWKDAEAYVVLDKVRNAEIDLRMAGQAQRLAVLDERTCLILRLLKEEGKYTITVIPAECREKEMP